MNLGVTGLGMITTIGRDAATSCASIRAGLSRPHEIHDYPLMNPETLEPVPLIGHPLRGFAEGFNMVGLWTRLAKHCLGELVQNAGMPGPQDTKFWDKTALVGVMPYISDDRFMSGSEAKPDRLVNAFLAPLTAALGWPIPSASLHPICLGHSGSAVAVELADKLISTGLVSRVVVLAVDSYLDTASLEWLERHRRLKAMDNPTGLMPGEAGACILLENADAGRQRGAPNLATIEGVGTAKETNDFFSGAANRGVGLAQAIRQALGGATPSPFEQDVISDHNGEEWRGTELAGARMALHATLSPEAPLTFPAACLGDVGAASGAVAMAVAVRGFVRNYARGQRTLVLSSSEHGDVGAILLRKAA